MSEEETFLLVPDGPFAVSRPYFPEALGQHGFLHARHGGGKAEPDNPNLICAPACSDIVKGCFYTPGSGWNPFYKSRNGLNQDGVALVDLELPKGKWTRQVVGIGNYCPGTIQVNFVALRSRTAGDYHYYLDNIVIRKRDGGLRSVIWCSESDFASLLFRYKGKNYDSLEKAQAVNGFPLSDIQIGVVKSP